MPDYRWELSRPLLYATIPPILNGSGMRLKKICLFFILSSFFLSAYAASAFGECPGDKLRVDIQGNTKTKNSTILRLAYLKGDCVPEGGIELAFVKQELLNSHLFSSVEVSLDKEPGLTTVHITVKDKWTIIPIPILYTSAEVSGGGLMILESNLLGRKKIAMIGASINNHGFSYEGIYIDDAVYGTRWIGVIRPLIIERDVFQYHDEEKVYAYHEKFNLVFGIIGYRVTDHIAPGVGFIYRYRDLEKYEDYKAPPNEGRTHGAMLNLRFGDVDFTDYYDKGYSGTVVLERALREFNAKTIYGHLQVTTDFTYPVWKLLSRSFVGGGWSFGEDVQFTNYWRLGGEVGNRGLPIGGLWVSNYFSVSQQIEEVVYRPKFGVITVAQFVDGVFTAEDYPFRSYPAIGPGLRVYLKQIAIPAVGVDAGYSLRTGGWHVSAYAGKAF